MAQRETCACSRSTRLSRTRRFAAAIALASARPLELLNGNSFTGETFGVDGMGERMLATIRIAGRDVGNILIEEGLARRWPDGRKFWC